MWINEGNAVVVDPAIAEPVHNWLIARKLNLCAILQTHHHSDHIGGTEALLQIWPEAEVVAARADLDRIPFQTISVEDGDVVELMGCEINVLAVPGHTSAHLAYYLNKDKGNIKQNTLFCGDTLFSGGCGRLFEGSPLDMFLSLRKLNSLPQTTKIFCAHEYTEANLSWANSLDPENKSIRERLAEVEELREKGLLSLPSTISQERSTNLFLMAKTAQELGKLRKNKDNWRG